MLFFLVSMSHKCEICEKGGHKERPASARSGYDGRGGERNMKIILDITDEEYEVLRDYGTSLKSEDGHELRAPLKRGAEQALREWVVWKAAEKKERHE